MNMSFEKLAELIFPNVNKTPEDYVAMYPKRNLKEGAGLLNLLSG